MVTQEGRKEGRERAWEKPALSASRSSTWSIQNGEKITLCCLKQLALVFLSFQKLNDRTKVIYISWSKYTWLPPSKSSGSRMSLILAISYRGQFKNDSHHIYYLDTSVF